MEGRNEYLALVATRSNPEHVWLSNWITQNSFYTWSDVSRKLGTALTHHDPQWRAMRAREVCATIFIFEIPFLTFSALTLKRLVQLFSALHTEELRRYVDTSQLYFVYVKDRLQDEIEERKTISPETIPWWSDSLVIPRTRKGGGHV